VPRAGNAPPGLDLVIRVGSDFAFTLYDIVDSADAPFDFTGATITCKVRTDADVDRTDVTLTATPSSGQLVLTMSAAHTALLDATDCWYLDVTKSSVRHPWLAGGIIPLPIGRGAVASTSRVLQVRLPETTLSINAAPGSSGGGGSMTGAEILAALLPVDGTGSNLDADTVDGQHASAFEAAGTASTALAAHVAASDPHTGYVLESVLTTTGDILTRGASAPDRVTRASLATDTAFSSRYLPLHPTVATVAGTTDTLSAADHGTTVRYTNASLVTVTLPTDGAEDLPDGFWCALHAEGAAGLTLSVSGITLAPTGANKTIAVGEVLVVMKTPAANTWMPIGGTSA